MNKIFCGKSTINETTLHYTINSVVQCSIVVDTIIEGSLYNFTAATPECGFLSNCYVKLVPRQTSRFSTKN